MAALAPSLARAEQVTVTNVSYTHSGETTSDSHYRVKPLDGSPTNWKSPVDYSKGSVHVLLDVKTKPTSKETRFQICFEATPNYACTDQSPIYTKTGKLEWDTAFSAMWQPDRNNPVDWSQGTRQVALILKDTSNGKPQGDAEYVPTDLHVEVTLVSAGATFTPGAGGAPIAPPPDGGTATPTGPDAGGAGLDGGTRPMPLVDAATSTRDAGRDAGRSVDPPGDDDDDDDDADGMDTAPSTGQPDAGSAQSEEAGGCNLGAASASGGVPFAAALMLPMMISGRFRRWSKRARSRGSRRTRDA